MVIMLYSYSSILVYSVLKGYNKSIFKVYILMSALVFLIEDPMPDHNKVYQVNALEQIHSSNEQCVEIKGNGKILSWKPIDDCADSKLQSEVLEIWKVSSSEKLFYQKY